MDVLVVESPAKAKTINKYLGAGFRVVPSYGHVRDLPEKPGSVLPEQGFAMVWEVRPGAEKHLRAIGQALKGAKRLYLATDPDREGEAISWHVKDELEQRKVLDGVEVKRIVFTQITRRSVERALSQPRDLDLCLIDAYRARRALDYLVGFTLSPLLWRKLPGARSAGRVQSVALRLVCEREAEIEAFVPREYWTVEAELETEHAERFRARLVRLGSEKLAKFSLASEDTARAAAAEIAGRALLVREIERKETRRNPAPPFITSTLQQEASRKLGLSPRRTMRIAQALYEGIDLEGETVGLITYMRTDGLDMAEEALAEARALIGRRFGPAYLPQRPRRWRSRVRNAQEAHEAIRPTSLARRPEDVARYLSHEQRVLYDLIWRRTLASQMEAARIDQVAAEIGSADGAVGLRATGSTVAFDGFLRVYREDADEPEAADKREAGEGAGDSRAGPSLPPLRPGQRLIRHEVVPEQHFTEPPPRYSEASLIKRLEELGIGRPSTYASIVSVLRERGYVRLERRRFMPEDLGRLTTAFLLAFFRRYVEYDFTAHLEDELDEVSAGQIEWRRVIHEFWDDFYRAVSAATQLSRSEVLEAVEALMAPHIFPPVEEGSDPRACPKCRDGRLKLKAGKRGPFIGCSRYPECDFTRPLVGAANERHAALPRTLGRDPATGLEVSVRAGPHGPYVQLGGGSEGAKVERRVGLLRHHDPETLDLETALKLLALPRELGPHPETGKPIYAGLGRYGPYVRHQRTYRRLGAEDDVLVIGINRAIDLLGQAPAKRPGVVRELGPHPEDGKPVLARHGRYGYYLQHDGVNAGLPDRDAAERITLDEAVALLAARRKTGKSVKAKSAGTRARSSLVRVLGRHPGDGKTVSLRRGADGHYVTHGARRVRLADEGTAEGLTLDEAVTILERGR